MCIIERFNTNEVVIYREDDPDTDDIDESTIVKERLSPRLRIPLENEFFQSKIIDNEGSDDLLNRDNFNLFVYGFRSSSALFIDINFPICISHNAKTWSLDEKARDFPRHATMPYGCLVVDCIS